MDLVEAKHAGTARHPWEDARFRFFRRVLHGARLDTPGTAFLDIGAGDGWFARQLAASAPGVTVVCCDSGYRDSGLPDDPTTPGAVRFRDERPTERFDVVTMLDVLEHVEHDTAFLGDVVATNVRPGGWLLFSVPAWQRLFSSHDVRLRHHRRYAPAECRRALTSAGLDVVRAGGLFHSLLPARAAQVVAERAGLAGQARHAGEWNASAALTFVVRQVLSWDGALSLAGSAIGWELPGLSWWGLCRRPS